MPTNLQRLSTCMTAILAALECPICFDTIPPPAHQCANGHLICVRCRVKTDQCPVCRMKFFRGRSLLADQVFNSLIDAFELRDEEESKRPKMLRQKLCGNQSEKTSKKPEIKVNFFSSPTNKFLTRIMGSGKSTSAENLTEHNRLVTVSSSLSIPTDSDFYTGLKAKSLSTNEIFREETQPLSRTGSVLSNRPGSGLLDVHPIKLAQRPASYHGSSEDLQSRLLSDFGIEFKTSQELRCCPCDPECVKSVTANQLMKHIQEWHVGPIIYFLQPKIEIDFPVILPYSTVISIACFSTVFVVRITDFSGKAEGNQVWLWCVSGDKYLASVTYGDQTRTCQVLSLRGATWKDIDSQHVVPLPQILEGHSATKLQIQLTSE